MFLCRLHEVREAEFGDVVGAEDVDVHDGFKGIRGELGEGCEEVSCCSSAVFKHCQQVSLQKLLGQAASLG